MTPELGGTRSLQIKGIIRKYDRFSINTPTAKIMTQNKNDDWMAPNIQNITGNWFKTKLKIVLVGLWNKEAGMFYST